MLYSVREKNIHAKFLDNLSGEKPLQINVDFWASEFIHDMHLYTKWNEHNEI